MENIFTSSFWSQVIDTAIKWVIEELPGILIITVIIFVAFFKGG